MPDMTDLLADIKFLMSPPTFKIVAQADLNDLYSKTALPVTFDDATAGRFVEWDPDAIITNADMASSGSRLEVGNHRAGIWKVGAAAHITMGVTEGLRRFTLLKNATERIGSATDNPDWQPGATHWAHGTLQDFAAGDDFGAELEDRIAEAVIGAPVSKARGDNYALPPTAWAIWSGNNATNTENYSTIGWSPSDHANIVDWWNDVVAVVDRLYARPAAGLRVSGTSTMPVGSWGEVGFNSTEFDTANMVSGSRLTAPIKGFYGISFGAQVDSFDLERGEAYLRIILNEGTGTESRLDMAANAPSDYREGGSVSVFGEGVIRLDAGETVGLFGQVFTGGEAAGSFTINGNGDTHLRMELLSAQVDITDRHVFTGGLPDLDIIDFSEFATDFAPGGLLTAMSRDLLGHLVSPPVIVAEMSKDATLPAGGHGSGHQWRRLPLNYLEFDTWGDNFVENPGTGITLPLDGWWEVFLRVTMVDTIDRYQPQQADDETQYAGNLGKRGIRVTLNGEVVSELVADPMLYPTHNWSRTVSGMVLGAAGDELHGEAMHTALETLTLPGRGRSDILGDVRLCAVWRGDGRGLVRARQSQPAGATP